MGEPTLKAYHRNPVTLKEQEQTIMVKLTAPDNKKEKAELDIVFVLDVSGSMAGAKIKSMQAAMKYLIEKLGDKDRIAIVSFHGTVKKHHEKLQHLVTKDDVKKANKIVDDLRPGGGTHIQKGLEAGLDLLDVDGRRQKKKVASCIFLMTDGDENSGSKAMNLIDRVGTHTIHTFGFGQNSNETLLFDIASRSHVGVYHHVPDTDVKDDLQRAFASSLAIFRTICLLDLEVTLKASKAGGCKILRVHPCDYRKNPDGSDGTWTIHFGDLARQENRRILVDVSLPKASKTEETHVLDVTCKYSPPNSNPKNAKPLAVKIQRNQTADENAPEEKQVNRELVRRTQANTLKLVKDSANRGKLEEARKQVLVARNVLSSIGNDSDDAIDSLYNELDNLDKFLESPDAYKKLGHAYLLACISSHDRQRYAARGGEDPVDFFLTDRMRKYLGKPK